jgi:hypothetical protein
MLPIVGTQSSRARWNSDRASHFFALCRYLLHSAKSRVLCFHVLARSLKPSSHDRAMLTIAESVDYKLPWRNSNGMILLQNAGGVPPRGEVLGPCRSRHVALQSICSASAEASMREAWRVGIQVADANFRYVRRLC